MAIQNTDFAIYTPRFGYEGRNLSSTPLVSIGDFFNKTGAPIAFGRIVYVNWETLEMSLPDGTAPTQAIGFTSYSKVYESVQDANGNEAIPNDRPYPVYDEGRFEVQSTTVVAAGDPVYFINDAASADNGRFSNATGAGATLLPGAKFEGTLAAPGRIAISIDFN